MLISLITWLICGSFIREFESFTISVDFCREPVTLAIAVVVSPLANYCQTPHLLTQLLSELCAD